MNWAWLAGFLLAQSAIGIWASRRIGSEEDFFVAGRQLGTPLVALSLFATWFGAETCLGAAGAVYSDGLSGARADPLGYALCLLLMGVFLAARFSRGRFVTLGDLYRQRYGVAIERLAVLVILPSSLIWGAAQIRAFAQVLAATGNLEVDTAVAVAAVLVILYTFIGGLLGDVVTDFVQGILLSAGLLALAWMSIGELGDGEAIARALSPDRLSLIPAGESLLSQADRWAAPVFGSLVAQELIARVLAARSPAVARHASFWAFALYLLIGAAPIALGLLGPALVPDLADPEQLLPTLAERYLPHALYLLFSWALLAAILSTVDSILLSSSALVSHNILVPLLRLESKERAKLWLGRGVVVVAGILSYVMANAGDSIYDLVETASTFGTAGVLVTTVAALYWRRGDARAAGAALIAGLVTTPLAEHVLELEAPFLAAIGAAVASYVALALLLKQPEPATAE